MNPGLAANPDEGGMLQVARNLTDAEGGFLSGMKYLLMDRDPKPKKKGRLRAALV